MSLRGVECVLAVIGTGGPVKRSNTKSSFTWKTAPRSTHMHMGASLIPVAGTNHRRGERIYP
eukprot:3076089-Pyramimonas_sp.AAC.1